MNLIPVHMDPKKGSWVLLENAAMGYLTVITCLYVVGKCSNPRKAKKVASALNKAIGAMEWDHYFSSFRARVSNGEFPVGAKVLDAPLRAATPLAVKGWLAKYLPEPIDATAYDGEMQEEEMYARMYPHWGMTTNPLFDGEICSVA